MAPCIVNGPLLLFGCSQKLPVLFVGVSIASTFLFGVCIGAPDLYLLIELD